jgi:uncharacterized protein YbcV (DUF1398 family)
MKAGFFEKRMRCAIFIIAIKPRLIRLKNKTMFTLEHIREAHASVKSGADFPRYIKALRALGVTSYETFVSDGHTDYNGAQGYRISSPARYEALTVSATCKPEQFKSDLKAHQQGQTDYPTFCRDCATSGIEKWAVSMEHMTCTYYDQAAKLVLTEQIPQF